MTAESTRQYAGEVIATFASAIYHGAHTLENVPGILKRIIVEDLWQEYERPDGFQRFESFAEFVTNGLGTNINTLQHLKDAKAFGNIFAWKDSNPQPSDPKSDILSN